jgi:hypothetical protein
MHLYMYCRECSDLLAADEHRASRIDLVTNPIPRKSQFQGLYPDGNLPVCHHLIN